MDTDDKYYPYLNFHIDLLIYFYAMNDIQVIQNPEMYTIDFFDSKK